MDMGIRGKKALVCAASKGLGKGCAMALAAEGVELTIVARTAETLEATAEELRKTYGVPVTAVACDITTPEGREKALAACPDPDILVNNAGGPPPGDFRDWTRDDWIAAVDANMLTPIELIKATVDGMIERKFGRIINITSSAVKAPIDILGLSNGARAGLTGFVAGIARKTVEHNVDQRPAARALRHRPPGRHGEGGGGQDREVDRGGARRAAPVEPGQALRHDRGVRRRLRLPGEQPRRLHHRPKPAARRRRLPGHAVAASRPGQPARLTAAGARPILAVV